MEKSEPEDSARAKDVQASPVIIPNFRILKRGNISDKLDI